MPGYPYQKYSSSNIKLQKNMKANCFTPPEVVFIFLYLPGWNGSNMPQSTLFPLSSEVHQFWCRWVSLGALGTRGDLWCKGESQTHVGGNSLQGGSGRRSKKDWMNGGGLKEAIQKQRWQPGHVTVQPRGVPEPGTCRQGMRWRHSMIYPSNNRCEWICLSVQ